VTHKCDRETDERTNDRAVVPHFHALRCVVR